MANSLKGWVVKIIPWWAALLVAFGFTAWSVLCVLIGASLSMSADKKLKAAQQNPRMN